MGQARVPRASLVLHFPALSALCTAKAARYQGLVKGPTRPKILLVDDEADIRELLSYNLAQAGYVTEESDSAESAAVLLAQSTFGAIVLDVMLPGMFGSDLLKRIRSGQIPCASGRDVPVILLTARGTTEERERGLALGADDYVQKPFSPKEVVLRVQAILRRSGAESQRSQNEPLRAGGIEVFEDDLRVLCDGEEVSLTALERRLLLELVKAPGRIHTRDELLDRVWGYVPGIESRTVDTHIKRLREKLGDHKNVIETIRGVGYRVKS